MMDMTTYLLECQRTKSSNFNTDDLKSFEIGAAIANGIISADIVDTVKKNLFYRKPIDREMVESLLVTEEFANLPFQMDAVDVDIIHAILGLYTEAGELLDLLFTALLDGKPIDPAKLMDEGGDHLWYLAIMFKKLGVKFEEIAGLNNAKLRVRFPEKFTEEQAVHRDLFAEMETFRAG